uniref:Secreted protein n=1 Tax=Steinernema glaseri TaxID=37863 RepID=A0A1I7YLZ8_9BILA
MLSANDHYTILMGLLSHVMLSYHAISLLRDHTDTCNTKNRFPRSKEQDPQIFNVITRHDEAGVLFEIPREMAVPVTVHQPWANSRPSPYSPIHGR